MSYNIFLKIIWFYYDLKTFLRSHPFSLTNI